MLQMTSLLGGAFGALFATNVGAQHGFSAQSLVNLPRIDVHHTLPSCLSCCNSWRCISPSAGGHRHFGIEGWRVAFLTVAAISLVISYAGRLRRLTRQASQVAGVGPEH